MKLFDEFHFGVIPLLALLWLVMALGLRRYPTLARTSLHASLRAGLQVLALGVALGVIFDHDSWFANLLALTLMLLFATLEGKNTPLRRYPRAILFVVMTLSLLLALTLGLLTQTLSPHSREFIPLSGMILGNSLSAYLLAASILQEQLVGNLPAIKGRIALGIPLHLATQEERDRALEKALIPILNNLRNLGVIFIPGAMTGMILAGLDPIKAASLQLSIMILLLFGSLSACYILTRFLYREIFCIYQV